jgi:hypothetical protein
MVDYKDEIENDFAKRTKSWADMLAAVKADADILARYGTPTEGRFRYPVEKARTRANVDVMREAESNLDVFWSQVDRLMHQKAGGFTETAVNRQLSQPRDLQRTPAWIEPIKESKDINSVDTQQEPSKSLSDMYSELQMRTESTAEKAKEPIQPKTKVKTRGKPDQSQMPPIVPEPSRIMSGVVSQPRYYVDKRALKVFRTLFYTPSMTSTPGEIPWADFLYAMASTGFMVEKLYGSVWQFRPTKLDVETPIQFHEPHPEGKVPDRTARRQGRRLNRAYGWSGEMFILAENKSNRQGA